MMTYDFVLQACKDAKELNVAVTGSEIVGLVPLNAILQAANYYIEKEKLMILEEDQKVHLVITRLGLGSIQPFDARHVFTTRFFLYFSNILNWVCLKKNNSVLLSLFFSILPLS